MEMCMEKKVWDGTESERQNDEGRREKHDRETDDFRNAPAVSPYFLSRGQCEA